MSAMRRARASLAMLLICCATQAAAQNSFSEQAPSPQPTFQNQPQQQFQTQPQTQGQGPIPRPPMGPQGQVELQDFGVQAKNELHAGAMHGPTPASIPGGRVITTPDLVELRRAQPGAMVFDVLGGPEVLPGAVAAVPAHKPGSFNDQTQREFGQFLQQVTQGRKDTPLVFYCQSVQCWMSYNASLRAIRMGYTQVLWYRGGIEAWKQAGQAVQPAGGPR